MGFIRIALAGLATGVFVAMGAVCSAAAIATQGGRFSNRLDIAAHFAPFWLAGGLAVLGFAMVSSRGPVRVILVTLGVIAVVGAGEAVLSEYLRPMSPKARADAPHQLKLIQFNTFIDNRDMEGTARWIGEQDADIVVMEEVYPEMRDAVLRHHPYHVTCGDCSVMIFSRERPTADNVPWDHDEHGPRAPLVRGTFDAPGGGEFTVFGLHYTWPTDGWVQQAQGARVATVLDKFDHTRLIVAGDFNSTPWSFTRRAQDRRFGLERRDKAVFSWPAQPITSHNIPMPVPFLPIDHVYAGSDWKTVKVERGPRTGSDHYPVIVTLALTQKP
jgi:endonuclease/exonuclease/phosphatase (EEP) superfamily protein YafD